MLVMTTLYRIVSSEGHITASQMPSSKCLPCAGESVQSTNGKDSHERNLLFPRQLKLRQQRHGHDEQGQIRSDVHGGVEKPHRLEIQTVPDDVTVPELRYRDAIEECAENGPGGIGCDDAHHDKTGYAERPGWEYA